METILIAVLSALAVSAVSFIGVATFTFNQDRQKKIIHLLLSLAAGAMLGNALLHLLPHALEDAREKPTAAIVQVMPEPNKGVHHDHDHGAMPVIEKQHDHDHDHEHDHDHDAKPAVQDKHEDNHEDKHEDKHDHQHSHGQLSVFALLLTGFFALFAIDLLLVNHHNRDSDQQTHGIKPLGYLVLVSDGLENFLDGLVIGAAFLVSIPAGIATTLAIFLHEVPMELGDYAVLRHSGFSRRKALLLNFGSAMVNVVGVVLALVLGNTLPGFSAIATPFASGAILYLAATGLLPQIRIHGNGLQKLSYFGMTLLGVALMALILLIE